MSEVFVLRFSVSSVEMYFVCYVYLHLYVYVYVYVYVIVYVYVNMYIMYVYVYVYTSMYYICMLRRRKKVVPLLMTLDGTIHKGMSTLLGCYVNKHTTSYDNDSQSFF